MYMHVFVHIRQNFGSKLAKYKILYLFAASWRRMKTSGRVAWRKVYMAISGTGHNSSQDLGANSSTSTHGPWSGHQIILYWPSDAWKIKHSLAVMTADTVRLHWLVHIRRAHLFREIMHVIKINTHKYIHDTYIQRTQYIHKFCVCILFVLVCMFVFVCILLVCTSWIRTNTY